MMSPYLTGADRISAHAREYGTCVNCRAMNGLQLYGVADIFLCEECLFDVWSEVDPLLQALDERDVERRGRELR